MKISQYANATPLGVSSKLIGTNVSANDETANFTISDVLGLGDAYFAPNDYGSFFDSTTQNVTAGQIAGVDVPNSATHITLEANTNYAVASWNFFQQVTNGQYAQIMWSQDDTISLLAEVADVILPHPAVPSVILTVNRVY